MQNNWIGKSLGANVNFKIIQKDETIEVFTTRPDTLFGASFIALAPSHPISLGLSKNNPLIDTFINECNKNSTSEAVIEKNEKGYLYKFRCRTPFDKNIKIPVYIANFVLMEYGTGAIFGCPAHDQRDLDFANNYKLPVLPVVKPKNHNKNDYEITDTAFTDDGTIINSSFLNGLNVKDAKKRATDELEKINLGRASITWRLRDWGVSRQRYWGCPIPIIKCKDCGDIPVPIDELPVKLPKDINLNSAGNPLELILNGSLLIVQIVINQQKEKLILLIHSLNPHGTLLDLLTLILIHHLINQ